MPPVVLENRVRFAETDQQGVVFYGTFFTYQDEAFNAYLRAIDYRYRRMRAEGWTTHIVHAELDYEAVAEFEDVILNELRITAIGDSSITFEYTARRDTDDETLATGNATHVTVATETDEVCRVPGDFRDAVVAYQDEPPTPA